MLLVQNVLKYKYISWLTIPLFLKPFLKQMIETELYSYEEKIAVFIFISLEIRDMISELLIAWYLQ